MTIAPRHLMLNLLLGHGGAPLSARQLLAACALFGISDNSARVALTRLSAARLVQAAGRGAYALGPKAQGLAADVGRWREAESHLRAWQGQWIAVHTGALARDDRAALRERQRALDLLGLRALERGLWLRPDNLAGGVQAVRARLQALGLPGTARVFCAEGFDPATEQQARALWDLAALSRGYRATRLRLERWLDRAHTLDADRAAREAFALGHQAIRQLVFDPWLPAPLVDVDTRRAFVHLVQRFDDAGHALWRDFLARAAGDAPETPADTDAAEGLAPSGAPRARTGSTASPARRRRGATALESSP
ncbi:MAG: PaaX family transcriptional regulator [Burkholderiales bacterium]|nr:PaaX family transcriptional regulator [Burkholderiales bacterium]